MYNLATNEYGNICIYVYDRNRESTKPCVSPAQFT